MSTTNARKHIIPTGSEASVSRETIFLEFAESIRDVVPVATVTARSQLVTALTAAGEAPSSTRPLVVYRHDAPGLHRLEWTIDGTVWIPSTGILPFASTAARDTWTTSNASYLTSGDRCRVGSVEFSWDGAAWRSVNTIATFTFTGGGVGDSGIVGASVPMTAVSAETTDSSFITATSGISATVKPGLYVVTLYVALNSTVTGRTFASINKGATRLTRSNAQTGEDSLGTTAVVYVETNGTVLSGEFFKVTGGLSNVSGRFTIAKLG